MRGGLRGTTYAVVSVHSPGLSTARPVWEPAEAARAASSALVAEAGDDPFSTGDVKPVDGLRGEVR